ncbi:MAG: hypothetical protein ACE5NP_01480 [Anaerolineae bacterium]
MPYVVEVDQSGKIGDTKVPTVLAFSNGDSYAVLIPAAVKRAYLRELRQRGKSGTTLYLQLFATGLYLLLKDHIQDLSQVTIDVEYPGHNVEIKLYLLNLLRRAGITVPAARIQFQRIGKKSGAHKRAKAVFIGAAEADQIIELGEILAEF